ncbi:hypothetical protein [Effusibacillus consociatus]|uniref:Uncharacterized protein n=1 Tax=Effusibacillus consociatus TaxID=1117041 RepID=A0ABV9Q6D4_9BACL
MQYPQICPVLLLQIGYNEVDKMLTTADLSQSGPLQIAIDKAGIRNGIFQQV